MEYCKFCKKKVEPAVARHDTNGEISIEHLCPNCGSLIREKRYPKAYRIHRIR